MRVDRVTVAPARLLYAVAVGLLAAWAIHNPCPAQEPSAYQSDMAAFFDEVDRTYPFFELKGIRDDWEETKADLGRRVADCSSDSEFLGLVVEAIQCLRDSHMWLRDAKAEIPRPPTKYYPGVSFMPATKDRVVVVSSAGPYAGPLTRGTIVTKIDGQDARTYLEERAREAWRTSFCSGPQRARMFEYRIPLRGERGDAHTVAYLVDGREQEMTLACGIEARGWPHTYNVPPDLKRVGRSSFYATLPGGEGYMYLRRVDDSAEPGIDQALAACPNAKGWIVDLRGNGGGGYGRGLIERFEGLPRPVAALIDAGCMSAGETVARDLVRCSDARLFGSRTAGSSTSKRTWTFPSGIASVVMSTRSRWRNDGAPIEYNGIEPDVIVEAVPEEVGKGRNSCILRAVEYLRKEYPRHARREVDSGSEAGGLEVVIDAWIEGDTELHVTPRGFYWTCREGGEEPGGWNGERPPTYVNGAPWWPKWDSPAGPGDEARSTHFMVKMPPLERIGFALLSVGPERGGDGIEERDPVTTRHEVSEFVVSIPDTQKGARWYRLRFCPR